MSIESNKTALVSKILTFSCVDGPGNRLVLFLQGCNYNCITCHNPQTINHCNHCGDCVAPCPANALSMVDNKIVWDAALCTQCDKCLGVCPSKSSPKITRYTVQQLLDLITLHHPFLSGITISGGEATLQLPFIIDLFKAIKNAENLKHLSCFIDSNGSLSQQGWQRVLPYLDGAMIDLKAWQKETHQWLVGKENHRVFRSIEQLAKHNKLYEVRLLYIPEKTDLLQEVDAVADYLAALPSDIKIRLNAFQHHGVVGEALSWDKCSKQQMEQLRGKLVSRLGREVITPSVYT